MLFGNVSLHFGLGPALQIGLAFAGNAHIPGGHILGDGAACGGVSAVAHGYGCNQIGVAAHKHIVADGGAELIFAVVVAGNGAAAEVAVLTHIRIANVGEVAHGVAHGKVGIFGFHISAQMHAVAGNGVFAHMGVGADLVVFAQRAVIHLAGVHGGVFANDGIFQQGVGADHAALGHDGFAPQNGAGQQSGTRGHLHAAFYINILAHHLHTGGDQLFQNGQAFFTPGGKACTGSLALLHCQFHCIFPPRFSGKSRKAVFCGVSSGGKKSKGDSIPILILSYFLIFAIDFCANCIKNWEKSLHMISKKNGFYEKTML